MKINDIKRVLGEPYFQHGNIALYHTDSLRAMRKLPHGAFDATITSPPSRIDNRGQDGIPLDQYISWSSEWMQEAYKLTKRPGSFWLGLGCTSVKEIGKHVPLSYLLWNRSDFYLMQEFPGAYPIIPGEKQEISKEWNKLLWFVKDSGHYYLDDDKMHELVHDEADSDKIADNNHGTLSKGLMEKIILATTKPNDLILNPFICEDSTTLVADSLQRKVVGFSDNVDDLDHLIDRFP